MWHNITFDLGDWSGDGHNHFQTFHIEANYEVAVITDAYNRFCDKYKVDFINSVGMECGGYPIIPEDVTNVLLSLHIINYHNVINVEFGQNVKYIKEHERDKYNHCYLFDECIDEYIEIFFDIIKHEIPDFKWRYRDLEETNLSILDGGAYGFYSDLV